MTVKQAAKLVGISERAVYMSRAVLRSGRQDLVEALQRGEKKIKIPDACIGLGIKCMTPFEMLRLERARFVLGPEA